MLFRDGALYILGKLIPSALGFVTAMLLTWLLPTDAYGEYGLGMAVVMLGNNMLFDWLSASVLRWFQTHRDEPAFMPTVLALFGGAAAAALALAAATGLGLVGERAAWCWVLLAGTLAYAWFEFAARLQVGQFRPVRYLVMNLVRSVLILGGGALAAVLLHSSLAVLAVSFAAMLAAGCLFAADGSLRLRRAFDPALARALLAYGAPMGLTMIFYGLTTSANRVLLGALSTPEAVGAFTVGFMLVQNTLGVIANGIGSATYSAAVAAVERGDPAGAREQLARNLTLLLGLLLPAGAGLALLAPRIATLFISPQYHAAVSATVPWLAVAAVLMGLRANYVDLAFQLSRRTGLLAQVMGVTAAVNVGLAVALIPRWGHVGAAAAMACACAVAFLHASLLAGRCFPLPTPGREAGCIVLATAAMALAVAAALSLPGVTGLLAQVAAGVAVYAAALVALDVLGLRGLVGRRLHLFARASATGLSMKR